MQLSVGTPFMQVAVMSKADGNQDRRVFGRCVARQQLRDEISSQQHCGVAEVVERQYLGVDGIASCTGIGLISAAPSGHRLASP